MEEQEKKLKGYLLVFLTALISGFAIFINRFGVQVFSPYIFTWLKNSLVAVFLTGLFLVLKDWKVLGRLNRKQWFLLTVIGLVGGSIPFLLFFKGLSLTSAVKGAFLHKTMFVYVALLAFVFLKEKIDRKFLLGGLLLILGNLFLFRGLSLKFNQGDLLIFSATLFWAVENTISKHVLKELSGRTVAWGRMFFGSLFIFIFLLFSGQLSLISNFTISQVSWILTTSVFLFGYVMTWYSGLRYIPVSKAAVILLLGLPITTLLSFIWTGQITGQSVLAALLIVGGIVFVFGVKQAWEALKKLKNLVHVRS